MKKAIAGLLLVVLSAIPESTQARGLGGFKKESRISDNPYSLSRAVETQSISSIPSYVSCFNRVCEIKYSIMHKINPDFCQTPNETISLGKGDCKDMTFYLYYLLKDKGEKSRVVIGKFKDWDLMHHAWIEYEYKGETLILDPANKKIIKRSSLKKYDPQYKEKNMDSTNRQIKVYMDDYESWLKENKIPK